MKPTVALFTGDPAGIGPELVTKLLADPATLSKADVILIGQRGQVAEPAGVRWHDWAGADAPVFPRAQATADNGRYMLQGLEVGARLAQSGVADAFCFAPLNKGALRAGGMHQEDELRWFSELLAFDGICGELNVLENLWTARVTSHVALKEVSELLAPHKVADAIGMIHRALQASGKASPRIAVCGLNPHAGEHGLFGDEDALQIAPAVEAARAEGIGATGPHPADTVFFQAVHRGRHDAIVCMYHDQGHAPMKLLAFESGVNVTLGLPIVRTSVDHGTAFDIAWKGSAFTGSVQHAVAWARRLVSG